MDTPFVGRQIEIRELKQLQQLKTASLVIVQGRRRIGKSRLIEEFAKGQKFYRFTGIAPTKKTTLQMQLDEFARQLSEQFSLPKFVMQDWGDLFTLLYKQIAKGKIIVLLDEISWMGSLDATFLSKLKNAWDTQFKTNAKLILVLCGSVSSWIENNIISSTLFLGRPSLYMKLNELTSSECNQFWGEEHDRISPYEKFKVLSITGGIPRYLELINPHLSAEENIRTLCFTPNAPLLNEFERIFSDIFGSRSAIYKKIIRSLVTGPASLEEILISNKRTKTGDFSQYLSELEMTGFIARDYTWHLKTGNQSKLSKFRLKDNYVRFYLKYIEPNKVKIEKGLFQQRSLSAFSGWDGIMGLQFQNLVLNNSKEIIRFLDIPLEDVVFVNPYFQQKTKQSEGCQIDLLIQTKFNCLYVCEIKFSKSELPLSVTQEVNKKIEKLKLPRKFSYRPVLIQVNGVRSALQQEHYFSKIIDLGTLLQGD